MNVVARVRRRIWQAIAAAAAAMAVCGGLLAWDGLCDNLGQADIGLVFGSKVRRDGVPSSRLRARLDRTVELYRAGYFPVVLASGGFGKEGHDEAAVMRDYLVSRGIPPDCVIVDSNGNTTYDTARNALRIIHERKLRSALAISQYFHVPRARWTLRRLGVAPVYSAHARYFELRDLYSIAREVFAFARYALRRDDADAADAPYSTSGRR